MNYGYGKILDILYYDALDNKYIELKQTEDDINNTFTKNFWRMYNKAKSLSEQDLIPRATVNEDIAYTNKYPEISFKRLFPHGKVWKHPQTNIWRFYYNWNEDDKKNKISPHIRKSEEKKNEIRTSFDLELNEYGDLHLF